MRHPESIRSMALDLWAQDKLKTEIAEILDVPVRTIHWWVKCDGSGDPKRRHPSKFTKEQRHRAVELYAAGGPDGSSRAVAKKVGTTARMVIRWARAAGVTIRPQWKYDRR